MAFMLALLVLAMRIGKSDRILNALLKTDDA